ncbi:unnamed protein product [Rotaria sordida]|nr:unnamed protein product [Rotaria sordida]
MKAVALTQTEDLDIGLSLVFFVCDDDHSKEINASRIIEFIEVIAELHAGETAVDTNRAKSIAMEIMNSCQKAKDGTVTEMEFIQCCKKDIDIAKAFLPQLEDFPVYDFDFGF